MPSIHKKQLQRLKLTSKLIKNKDFQTVKAKLKQENPLWKATDTKLN